MSFYPRKTRKIWRRAREPAQLDEVHAVESMDQVLAIALERPLPEVAAEIAANLGDNAHPIAPLPGAVVDQGPTTQQVGQVSFFEIVN
jgi:ADP-ribosylglycohydrolase